MSEDFASTPATTMAGRRLRRAFDAQAFDAELDRQGRILIPSRLRELAGLDGTVIVAGNRECLEIWNPKAWEVELERAETDSPEEQRREE